MINTQSFVEIVEEMIIEKVDAPFSLGKISPNYQGGNPQILFDGEASVSVKKYPHLSSYKPVSNDRVLLINIAGTHLVVGYIGAFRNTNTMNVISASYSGSNYQTGYSYFPSNSGLSLGYPAEDILVYTIKDSDFRMTQYITENSSDMSQTRMWIRKYYSGSWSPFQEILTEKSKTDWFSISNYGTGWSNNGGSWQVGSYMRDSDGFVNLRGLISTGSVEEAFVLPTGFRPPKSGIYSARDNGGTNNAKVYIYSYGEVRIQSSASWVSLAGLRFSVN